MPDAPHSLPSAQALDIEKTTPIHLFIEAMIVAFNLHEMERNSAFLNNFLTTFKLLKAHKKKNDIPGIENIIQNAAKVYKGASGKSFDQKKHAQATNNIIRYIDEVEEVAVSEWLRQRISFQQQPHATRGKTALSTAKKQLEAWQKSTSAMLSAYAQFTPIAIPENATGDSLIDVITRNLEQWKPLAQDINALFDTVEKQTKVCADYLGGIHTAAEKKAFESSYNATLLELNQKIMRLKIKNYASYLQPLTEAFVMYSDTEWNAAKLSATNHDVLIQNGETVFTHMDTVLGYISTLLTEFDLNPYHNIWTEADSTACFNLSKHLAALRNCISHFQLQSVEPLHTSCILRTDTLQAKAQCVCKKVILPEAKPPTDTNEKETKEEGISHVSVHAAATERKKNLFLTLKPLRFKEQKTKKKELIEWRVSVLDDLNKIKLGMQIGMGMSPVAMPDALSADSHGTDTLNTAIQQAITAWDRSTQEIDELFKEAKTKQAVWHAQAHILTSVTEKKEFTIFGRETISKTTTTITQTKIDHHVFYIAHLKCAFIHLLKQPTTPLLQNNALTENGIALFNQISCFLTRTQGLLVELEGFKYVNALSDAYKLSLSQVRQHLLTLNQAMAPIQTPAIDSLYKKCVFHSQQLYSYSHSICPQAASLAELISSLAPPEQNGGVVISQTSPTSLAEKKQDPKDERAKQENCRRRRQDGNGAAKKTHASSAAQNTQPAASTGSASQEISESNPPSEWDIFSQKISGWMQKKQYSQIKTESQKIAEKTEDSKIKLDCYFAYSNACAAEFSRELQKTLLECDPEKIKKIYEDRLQQREKIQSLLALTDAESQQEMQQDAERIAQNLLNAAKEINHKKNQLDERCAFLKKWKKEHPNIRTTSVSKEETELTALQKKALNWETHLADYLIKIEQPIPDSTPEALQKQEQKTARNTKRETHNTISVAYAATGEKKKEKKVALENSVPSSQQQPITSDAPADLPAPPTTPCGQGLPRSQEIDMPDIKLMQTGKETSHSFPTPPHTTKTDPIIDLFIKAMLDMLELKKLESDSVFFITFFNLFQILKACKQAGDIPAMQDLVKNAIKMYGEVTDEKKHAQAFHTVATHIEKIEEEALQNHIAQYLSFEQQKSAAQEITKEQLTQWHAAISEKLEAMHLRLHISSLSVPFTSHENQGENNLAETISQTLHAWDACMSEIADLLHDLESMKKRGEEQAKSFPSNAEKKAFLISSDPILLETCSAIRQTKIDHDVFYITHLTNIFAAQNPPELSLKIFSAQNNSLTKEGVFLFEQIEIFLYRTENLLTELKIISNTTCSNTSMDAALKVKQDLVIFHTIISSIQVLAMDPSYKKCISRIRRLFDLASSICLQKAPLGNVVSALSSANENGSNALPHTPPKKSDPEIEHPSTSSSEKKGQFLKWHSSTLEQLTRMTASLFAAQESKEESLIKTISQNMEAWKSSAQEIQRLFEEIKEQKETQEAYLAPFDTTEKKELPSCYSPIFSDLEQKTMQLKIKSDGFYIQHITHAFSIYAATEWAAEEIHIAKKELTQTEKTIFNHVHVLLNNIHALILEFRANPYHNAWTEEDKISCSHLVKHLTDIGEGISHLQALSFDPLYTGCISRTEAYLSDASITCAMVMESIHIPENNTAQMRPEKKEETKNAPQPKIPAKEKTKEATKAPKLLTQKEQIAEKRKLKEWSASHIATLESVRKKLKKVKREIHTYSPAQAMEAWKNTEQEIIKLCKNIDSKQSTWNEQIKNLSSTGEKKAFSSDGVLSFSKTWNETARTKIEQDAFYITQLTKLFVAKLSVSIEEIFSTQDQKLTENGTSLCADIKAFLIQANQERVNLLEHILKDNPLVQEDKAFFASLGQHIFTLSETLTSMQAAAVDPLYKKCLEYSKELYSAFEKSSRIPASTHSTPSISAPQKNSVDSASKTPVSSTVSPEQPKPRHRSKHKPNAAQNNFPPAPPKTAATAIDTDASSNPIKLDATSKETPAPDIHAEWNIFSQKISGYMRNKQHGQIKTESQKIAEATEDAKIKLDCYLAYIQACTAEFSRESQKKLLECDPEKLKIIRQEMLQLHEKMQFLLTYSAEELHLEIKNASENIARDLSNTIKEITDKKETLDQRVAFLKEWKKTHPNINIRTTSNAKELTELTALQKKLSEWEIHLEDCLPKVGPLNHLIAEAPYTPKEQQREQNLSSATISIAYVAGKSGADALKPVTTPVQQASSDIPPAEPTSTSAEPATPLILRNENSKAETQADDTAEQPVIREQATDTLTAESLTPSAKQPTSLTLQNENPEGALQADDTANQPVRPEEDKTEGRREEATQKPSLFKSSLNFLAPPFTPPLSLPFQKNHWFSAFLPEKVGNLMLHAARAKTPDGKAVCIGLSGGAMLRARRGEYAHIIDWDFFINLPRGEICKPKGNVFAGILSLPLASLHRSALATGMFVDNFMQRADINCYPHFVLDDTLPEQLKAHAQENSDFTVNAIYFIVAEQGAFLFDAARGVFIDTLEELDAIPDIKTRTLRLTKKTAEGKQDFKSIRKNPMILLRALKMIWSKGYTLDDDLRDWIMAHGKEVLAEVMSNPAHKEHEHFKAYIQKELQPIWNNRYCHEIESNPKHLGHASFIQQKQAQLWNSICQKYPPEHVTNPAFQHFLQQEFQSSWTNYCAYLQDIQKTPYTGHTRAQILLSELQFPSMRDLAQFAARPKSAVKTPANEPLPHVDEPRNLAAAQM